MNKTAVYGQQDDRSPYFIIGTGRCGTELMAHILSQSTNSICFHQRIPMTYDEITQIYRHEESCQFAEDIFERLKNHIKIIRDRNLIYGESSNHLFFLPNHSAVNGFFHPKYVFCIREPISFVTSALARGFYDPHHPYPLLNPLLPRKYDPIARFWKEIPPALKCLWYWIAKNDYVFINLLEKISPENWRIFLFDNLNDESAFEELFNFLNLKGFIDSILKIRFFMNTRVNATPTSASQNVLSTNPRSISGNRFTIDSLFPQMRTLFNELLDSSITCQTLYNKNNQKFENGMLEALSVVHGQNIKKMVIGPFYHADSSKSEKRYGGKSSSK